MIRKFVVRRALTMEGMIANLQLSGGGDALDFVSVAGALTSTLSVASSPRAGLGLLPFSGL